MRSRKAALALSGLCGPAIRSTTMMQLLFSISITANYGHVQCDLCSLLQNGVHSSLETGGQVACSQLRPSTREDVLGPLGLTRACPHVTCACSADGTRFGHVSEGCTWIVGNADRNYDENLVVSRTNGGVALRHETGAVIE